MSSLCLHCSCRVLIDSKEYPGHAVCMVLQTEKREHFRTKYLNVTSKSRVNSINWGRHSYLLLFCTTEFLTFSRRFFGKGIFFSRSKFTYLRIHRQHWAFRKAMGLGDCIHGTCVMSTSSTYRTVFKELVGPSLRQEDNNLETNVGNLSRSCLKGLEIRSNRRPLAQYTLLHTHGTETNKQAG